MKSKLPVGFKPESFRSQADALPLEPVHAATFMMKRYLGFVEADSKVVTDPSVGRVARVRVHLLKIELRSTKFYLLELFSPAAEPFGILQSKIQLFRWTKINY